MPSDSQPSWTLFRGIWLTAMLVVLGWLGWCINDLRLELKRSAETLNRDLPRILSQTKQSTETLALLSRDIKNLRDLAGLTGGAREHSIVLFADDVLDLIEKQPARIGKRKLVGRGLADERPANEWVTGARREAVYLSFRVRSRREMLEKLCKTLTGGNWYIRFEEQPPMALLEWVKVHHPASARLFEPVAGKKPPTNGPKTTNPKTTKR